MSINTICFHGETTYLSERPFYGELCISLHIHSHVMAKRKTVWFKVRVTSSKD